MKSTINIDIGGTFTDCYVVRGESSARSKVATTRYNLSVGFNQAITNCARELKVPQEELLEDTSVIRYATTLAMNALLERKGSKLGLITTAGFEDTVFIGRGAQWHDALAPEQKRNIPRSRRPEPLIPRDMVVGVTERIDSRGKVVIPLRREEVRRQLQQLVDRGVMGIVVSLLWSHANPEHEQLILKVIEEEYPDVFLGALPVLLSSQVLPKKNEYQRTMTTILDAYLHRAMADELMELGNDLREKGYRRPLYIVQNSGGCAPLERTHAVTTFNAGPVGGLLGAAHFGKHYDYDNIVTTDVGGTSFDIGLVLNGNSHFFMETPLIDWWRVGISMIETKSIGSGGGSIAWVNEDVGNQLEVGPRSASSLPGPACFDRGGEEATVTDADIVLGYIDPDYFLGGKMPLNKAKAEVAVERIAKKINMGMVETAAAIKKIVDGNMGNEVAKEIAAKGGDPRDFVMFAFGGGGPAHCCGYAEYAQVKKIVTMPSASVFSAMGVSIMDVLQGYEASRLIRLLDPVSQNYFDDYELFNEVIEGLKRQALRDLGHFGEESIQFDLDLEMRYGMQPNETRIRSPRLEINNSADAEAVHNAFVDGYGKLYGEASHYPQGGVEILDFCLWATVPTESQEPHVYPREKADPEGARRGTRKAYWLAYQDFKDTPVYYREQLRPGNIIEGPALIDSTDTTYVIDPGWTFTIDRFMNGVIEKN